MVCEDKNRLLAESNEAVQEHAGLSLVLSERVGNLTTADLMRLEQAARLALTKARRALAALEDHVQEHGC